MKSENLKDIKLKLSEQIKAARKSRNITQEALALAANIDRTYISQLERGLANPSLAILFRIADELGCELKVELSR